MLRLTEVVLGLCDLFEAEGRLLRSNVFRTTVRCTIFIGGAIFAAASFVLLLISAYEAMLDVLPRPLVLLLSALLSAIIAFVLIGSALWGLKAKK